MRRINDNHAPNGNMDEFEEEEYAAFFDKNIQAQEKLLIERDNSNRRLLFLAIKICEGSFWWRIKTYKNKMIEINKTYQILRSIISEESE